MPAPPTPTSPGPLPTLELVLTVPPTATTIAPSPTFMPPEPLVPTTASPATATPFVGENPFAGSLEALERLDSYRYRILFEVKGQGAETVTVVHLEGEVLAPDREHVSWLLPGGGLFLDVIRIGERAWVNTGGTWSELPAGQREDVAAGVLSPAQVWAGFVEDLPGTSVLVGEELVGGLHARHFRSTSRAWRALALPSGGQLVQATGDVWIAADGRFPIRLHFVATGEDPTGQPVSVDFTFELTDINEPILIEVPQ